MRNSAIQSSSQPLLGRTVEARTIIRRRHLSVLGLWAQSSAKHLTRAQRRLVGSPNSGATKKPHSRTASVSDLDSDET